jgi:hypothetical protein
VVTSQQTLAVEQPRQHVVGGPIRQLPTRPILRDHPRKDRRGDRQGAGRGTAERALRGHQEDEARTEGVGDRDVEHHRMAHADLGEDVTVGQPTQHADIDDRRVRMVDGEVLEPDGQADRGPQPLQDAGRSGRDRPALRHEHVPLHPRDTRGPPAERLEDLPAEPFEHGGDLAILPDRLDERTGESEHLVGQAMAERVGGPGAHGTFGRSARLGISETIGSARRLEQIDDLRSDPPQGRELVRRVDARFDIHRAHRPDDGPVGRDHRCAGVGHQPRIADDERVVDEARVLRGVLDDEGLLWFEDRVGAERDVAIGLLQCEADRRLDPLPGRVDERDGGDRCRAGGRDLGRERLEASVARTSEDAIRREGPQARGLVRRTWRDVPGPGSGLVIHHHRLDLHVLSGTGGCAPATVMNDPEGTGPDPQEVSRAPRTVPCRPTAASAPRASPTSGAPSATRA